MLNKFFRWWFKEFKKNEIENKLLMFVVDTRTKQRFEVDITWVESENDLIYAVKKETKILYTDVLKIVGYWGFFGYLENDTPLNTVIDLCRKYKEIPIGDWEKLCREASKKENEI